MGAISGGEEAGKDLLFWCKEGVMCKTVEGVEEHVSHREVQGRVVNERNNRHSSKKFKFL